jgi:hypothetical protein
VAICYTGEFSRTPGRRACGAVNAQAEANYWHAVDCPDCKGTLIGMRICPVMTNGTVQEITDVQGPMFSIVPAEAEPGAVKPFIARLAVLDNAWRVVP